MGQIVDAFTSKGITGTKLTRLALIEIPTGGTNPEILRERGMDSAALIQHVVNGIQT